MSPGEKSPGGLVREPRERQGLIQAQPLGVQSEPEQK